MASSYKCKNVEKTWQHNATSRHEKCALEGASSGFQTNLGKVWVNKFYLNILVCIFPMLCLHIKLLIETPNFLNWPF